MAAASCTWSKRSWSQTILLLFANIFCFKFLWKWWLMWQVLLDNWRSDFSIWANTVSRVQSWNMICPSFRHFSKIFYFLNIYWQIQPIQFLLSSPLVTEIYDWALFWSKPFSLNCVVVIQRFYCVITLLLWHELLQFDTLRVVSVLYVDPWCGDLHVKSVIINLLFQYVKI